MTAPAVIRSGVGFRHCQVLAIAADGYPAASDTNAYAGVEVEGPNTLVITDPEPRRITHAGGDRVFQQDVLPPLEAMSGTITTAKTNDTLDAVLADEISYAIGEAMLFGVGTDKRGDENQVIVLAYKQTLDTSGGSDDGARRWDFRLFPKADMVSLASGFDENPESRQYGVYPQFATEHPWGVDFSPSVEGFDRAQMLRGISVFKPKIVAFEGDGSEVTFVFPTGFPAADVSKIVVWQEGALVTPDAYTVTNLEISTATPADGTNIVVFYEVE